MDDLIAELEEVISEPVEEFTVSSQQSDQGVDQSDLSVSALEVTPDPYATAVPLPTVTPEVVAVPFAALEAAGTSAAGDAAVIADVQAAAYLPSGTSAQMTYFAGILAGDPWCDYYAYYNGDDYYLYYGYDLDAGDACDLIQISHDSYSQYTVTRRSGTFPAASAAALAYSNVYDDLAHFSAVEEVRNGSFVTISLVCALALWLLRHIFFR